MNGCDHGLGGRLERQNNVEDGRLMRWARFAEFPNVRASDKSAVGADQNERTDGIIRIPRCEARNNLSRHPDAECIDRWIVNGDDRDRTMHRVIDQRHIDSLSSGHSAVCMVFSPSAGDHIATVRPSRC